MYKINRYINDFENIKEIENLSSSPNPNAIFYIIQRKWYKNI
jgi:hypothetical protein